MKNEFAIGMLARGRILTPESFSLPAGAAEYSIHEASSRLGISVQKLRRWDERGILVARRTGGGHRRYAREIIDWLAGSGSAIAEEQENAARKASKDKRRMLQMLLESQNRYRDLVETSYDLIWSSDAEGRLTEVNHTVLRTFGVTREALLGQNLFDFEPTPASGGQRFLSLLRQEGEVQDLVVCLLTPDGEQRWLKINARAFYDAGHRMHGARAIARDITKERLAASEVEHLSRHDPVTDLPNRTSFYRDLESALHSEVGGAVVYLDLDHFKYVNTTFGHQAGDQLIIELGAAVRQAAREAGGEAYRLGGDKFACHLPRCSRSVAEQAGERMLDAVRTHQFFPAGSRRPIRITASAGMALYPLHGAELAKLLRNVDVAMYQAQEQGRNRCVLYDAESNTTRRTHKRFQWVKKLRDVLEEDRLVLYSQPVVRLVDQTPVHHEILVRVKDDDGTIILPSHFIELAESTGMIQEIDTRVVEKLIQHMSERKEMGRKLRYFVNLSRVSISDPAWVRSFQRLLANGISDPSQLVFEITETAAMSEIETTLAFIRQLKEMGCRFALDDFGAGFSSFYYLRRFDVDYLKIDGSFIRDIAIDEGSRVFVQALNDVARRLNKQVIAEWVENEDVRQGLLSMGAEFGQGYLFKSPAPLSDEICHLPVLA